MTELRDEAKGSGTLDEHEALDAHFALAAALLRRRRDLNLTQGQLAERCGVSQTEISRIESGLTNPTMATVSRLASALGATELSFTWTDRSAAV